MADWMQACQDTSERCWTAIAVIVTELGDPAVNRRPRLEGANSAYAIVHHCIEMSRWWLGTFGCGLGLPRDRSGEFRASGTADELLDRIAQVRADTAGWMEQITADGITGRDARGTTASVDLETVTPQWVVLHVIHELAQHLGQLELTRDVLGWAHD
ncbi:DinB family protein [Branchiibius cervicis]|uniref:DinB family protein n=1 Tax=Branchiibius cervicis TaxID=908252 RepID=A0ABW2ARB5_9MICO